MSTEILVQDFLKKTSPGLLKVPLLIVIFVGCFARNRFPCKTFAEDYSNPSNSHTFNAVFGGVQQEWIMMDSAIKNARLLEMDQLGTEESDSWPLP